MRHTRRRSCRRAAGAHAPTDSLLSTSDPDCLLPAACFLLLPSCCLLPPASFLLLASDCLLPPCLGATWQARLEESLGNEGRLHTRLANAQEATQQHQATIDTLNAAEAALRSQLKERSGTLTAARDTSAVEMESAAQVHASPSPPLPLPAPPSPSPNLPSTTRGIPVPEPSSPVPRVRSTSSGGPCTRSRPSTRCSSPSSRTPGATAGSLISSPRHAQHRWRRGEHGRSLRPIGGSTSSSPYFPW